MMASIVGIPETVSTGWKPGKSTGGVRLGVTTAVGGSVVPVTIGRVGVGVGVGSPPSPPPEHPTTRLPATSVAVTRIRPGPLPLKFRLVIRNKDNVARTNP